MGGGGSDVALVLMPGVVGVCKPWGSAESQRAGGGSCAAQAGAGWVGALRADRGSREKKARGVERAGRRRRKNPAI